MKRAGFIFVFMFLFIGAALFIQCGEEEKSPCKELHDKVHSCLNECKDYPDCQYCQVTLSSYPEPLTCEGEVKKSAEESLKVFNCDTMKGAVDSACKAE